MDNIKPSHLLNCQQRPPEEAAVERYSRKEGKPVNDRIIFGFRIVKLYNSLPDNTVTLNSINIFKNRLEKYWRQYKYTNEVPHHITRRNIEEQVDKKTP